MKIGFIYKITSPIGKIYVGQTLDCVKRVKTYKKMACKQQPKIYNSILKYNWSSHLFEVIEVVEFNEIAELNRREIFWIKQFNSLLDGLNCTGGGDSKEISSETIDKIRRSKIGKPSPNKGKN